MDDLPELELLKIRFAQAKEWLRASPFGRTATLLGGFVLVYMVIGLGVISTMVIFNVNPTLVVSVIAAPLWIAVIFIAMKIAKMLFGRRNNG